MEGVEFPSKRDAFHSDARSRQIISSKSYSSQRCQDRDPSIRAVDAQSSMLRSQLSSVVSYSEEISLRIRLWPSFWRNLYLWLADLLHVSLKYEGFYIPACLITLKEEEVEEEEEGVGAALHIICLLDRGSQQQGFRSRKKNAQDSWKAATVVKSTLCVFSPHFFERQTDKLRRRLVPRWSKQTQPGRGSSAAAAASC